ncbi:MAG: phosphotransferase [Chloroflexi bacterium]|nr:phosphotransferase [Chloroflexota bacterium]
MRDRLEHYLRLWHLSDPEPLAQTPTSHVYTVQHNGERAVLKLLTPIGVEDEQGGAVALRYFDGQGAVRLMRHDQEAHLLEYAGDEDLAPMVWRGEDVAAAAIIAGVLNQLHRVSLDKPPPELQPLRRRFRELFVKAARDEAAGEDSIYGRGARVAQRLLAEPRQECVLHGDIHHQNLRRHPVRGWLAFDPKGLYGERTYDAANTLCNPPHAQELVSSEARLLRITQVLANGMGIEVDRVRAFVFAYACLSASWLDDGAGDVRQQMLTVARNAERHVHTG